jgi:hypothetical protein
LIRDLRGRRRQPVQRVANRGRIGGADRTQFDRPGLPPEKQNAKMILKMTDCPAHRPMGWGPNTVDDVACSISVFHYAGERMPSLRQTWWGFV